MEKFSKSEAKKQIEKFFDDLENKNPKEVKKIKKFAMRYNIPLKEKRKLFCKNCYSLNLKIKSIKKGVKTLICRECNNIMRWKIT